MAYRPEKAEPEGSAVEKQESRYQLTSEAFARKSTIEPSAGNIA